MAKKGKKRGNEEWYLYHSIKNEDALIPVILVSVLTFFMHHGWIISIAIWIGYFIYCSNNNEELDNDEYISQKRQNFEDVRQAMESGEIQIKQDITKR